MSKEAKGLIAILVFVVVGMTALFLVSNGKQADKPAGDATKLVRSDSYKTDVGAVQVVEFGDYQCPACGTAYPVVKQILADYSGKITFYFRNFPLSSIHPNALIAANAAESAGAQGKYWEMHDKLYETQKDWSDVSDVDAANDFATYAKDLGLDGEKVRQAALDQSFKTRVSQDEADGEAQQINGTPTFFVNGKKVDSTANLRTAIDNAIAGK